MSSLDMGNLCLTPWCLEENCEETIKQKSGESSKEKQKEKDEQVGFGLSGSAKSLCIPFDQQHMDEHIKCFACGKDAKKWTLFGRSY